MLTDAGPRRTSDVEAAGFPVFNLYKLVVILRGKRLIDDVRSTTHPSAAAGRR